MDSQIVTLGDPTTLSVDYASGEAHLYMEKPSADIHTLFEREFSKYDHITVLLSGGLDSQFSANLAKRYAKSMNAVCFRFIWDGRVINATDIVNAQEFATVIGIDLDYEDFDLSYHYDNEQLEYLTHYRVYSPQLSAYIAAIKQSKHIMGTVLMGGEAPMVFMDNDEPRLVGKFYNSDDRLMSFGQISSMYLSHYAPFTFLDVLNGIPVIRDPFMMSPEIMYAAYAQNAKVITENSSAHFTHTSENVDTLQINTQVYKTMYYKSFGFDYVVPLNKRTGFESLRFHLACVTGNYDEYEKRYRRPIAKAMTTMPWASTRVFSSEDRLGKGVVKNVFHDDGNIEKTIKDAIKELTLTPTNYYNLDW
jgi:hypothetical protein